MNEADLAFDNDFYELGEIARSSAVRPAPELSGARILVLAGDRAVCDAVGHRLQLDRYVPESACSFGEFECIRSSLDKFDLLIVDAAQPDWPGFELCRNIRREHPLFKLPILMMTSRTRPEDAIAALSAGANDTLPAPVDADELQLRVRHLLLIKSSATEFIRMELAFLQAQIKPHFLYNTLSSIAALSEENHAVMRQLLDRFGTYLRETLRLDNLDPLVPLHQEMQLVQTYLEIEKIRFSDRLHATIAIGDDVDNVLIPPLSIQSLVENAVRHGLMTRKRGGSLTVSALSEGDACQVRVQDDGIGMARAAGVWHKRGSNSRGGGLSNIDRRLRMIYGTGLNIVSDPASGTRISFIIPLAGGLSHESHLN